MIPKDTKKDIFAKLKVMIVEDNPVDRELLKSQLEKMGFENIVEARSGSDAIFKIENTGNSKDAFHILITDWKMPERDGLALIKYLRDAKALQNTKVVMLTSITDEKKVRTAIREGIDDFIVKPIDFDVLTKKLENLIKRMGLV